MERRIELPSGGWCELRDPDTVTNRERKPIVEKAESEGSESSSLVSKLGFVDRLVVLMVTRWSFDFPIPKEKPESLDDLPGRDLDKIRLAVQEPETMPFLFKGDPRDPKASDGDLMPSPQASSTTTSSTEAISLTLESTG